MPVRFDCHTCGEPWWAPPGNGCPRCGYDARATPDPVIWTCGQLAGMPVWITGQMRNPARFACFLTRGISTFVDVAGDARYVWRPDNEAIDAAGVVYVRIPLEDTNVDLPDAAFDAVRDALEGADGEALLFCAAGLKRAPHLLYGVLRARGHGPEQAWELVRRARPMTDRFEPYIAAAERWAGSALPAGAESRSGSRRVFTSPLSMRRTSFDGATSPQPTTSPRAQLRPRRGRFAALLRRARRNNPGV